MLDRARALFTDHPHSVNEDYFEHMRTACGFACAMLRGGLACLVHAFLPFLCLRTGSETIHDLHERMVTHRVRNAPPAASPAPATFSPAKS
jgi:hypothetical protein